MPRSLESFEWHLKKTVAGCHQKWIILRRNTLLGDELMMTPHFCKSNYCEFCRPRNLLKIRRILYDNLKGEKWRLITLTFPDHSKDVLTTLQSLYRQFKRFIQRIRRKYPDVKFIRVIELHQSGYPHIHMIVNMYIPVAFIQKSWHDLGGGIVDIRAKKKLENKNKLPSYKQAARYLTEEIEKKIQDPHRLGATFWQAGCKPITTSRNLKMKKHSNDWSFYRMAPDFASALSDLQVLKEIAIMNNEPVPELRATRDNVICGVGVAK
jgi:hypothetical protein